MGIKFLKTMILCFSLYQLMACTDKPGSTRTVEYTELGCTEIMYHSTSLLEFIELKITKGPALPSMVSAEMRIQGAVNYTFPNEPLDTGEYIVVVNDLDLFHSTYPDFSGRVFGPWDKNDDGTLAKLSNEGDVIELRLSGQGDANCSFSGEPPWPSLANGKGRSLVFFGENSSHFGSWAAHAVDGGNPGGPDTYVPNLAVRINEVMPSFEGNANWVELYNSSAESIDLSGWEFNVVAKDTTFILPEGTVIGPKEYLVLDGTEETGAFGSVGLFVSADGSDYYLREVIGGVKTGGESSLTAPAGELSSGFTVLADLTLAQGTLAAPTPGTANEILLSGPVFINEFHYHPIDLSDEVEFLELVNKSDEMISLTPIIDTKASSWKVTGINMSFPPGAYIPANGMAILIETSSDSVLFRTKNNIASDIPIYCYDGRLSNRGELLVVKKPFSWTPNPEKVQLVSWNYSFVDAVLYSDRWAGMREADGLGKSLHRVDFSTMGYESGAWKAAAPTPGR